MTMVLAPILCPHPPTLYSPSAGKRTIEIFLYNFLVFGPFWRWFNGASWHQYCAHTPPLYIHSCWPAHYSNVQKRDTVAYICTLYIHCGIRMYTLYSDVAKRRIPSLRSAGGRCVSNVKSHISACYCENFQGDFARFDLPNIFCCQGPWCQPA